MTVSGGEVAEAYERQAEALQRLIASYRELYSENKAKLEAVTEQLKLARRELAAVYLPELSDAAFERTGRLTGFQGFQRRDPRAALAHERHVLEASLAKIEADARYANRDTATAQLQAELTEARETLVPLQADCDRFERLEGFKELVALGYDTPKFAEKWWQASYWKHWAAGDRICKELRFDDFGDDVLPAYNKHAEPRNFMAGEVKRLEAALDALHELVRERDKLADRLAHLDEIYLAEAQDFLAEHLQHADAALLEQWVANEPQMQRAVQMGLRKIAGLSAKIEFIRELNNDGVNNLVNQLETRRGKAQGKAIKFRRDKYRWATFPNQTIDTSFDQKLVGLNTQRDKVRGRVDRLVAADEYGGFDLRNDQQLWWLYLMQSPPPRLAPGLYDYYQKRPNAQPMVDPDYVDVGPTPGEAAALAYAAGELEQGGYLS